MHAVPSPTEAVTGLASISQLTFQNARLGHALLFLGAGVGSAGYAVLSTTDGGSQWTLETQKILLGSDGPSALSFPGHASTGWFANGSSAGAYTVVAKTADNGASWSTWSQVSSEAPPSALSVHFSSITSGFMVVSTNGYQTPQHSLYLQTTTDGGRLWETHMMPTEGLPLWIRGLSFVNPKTGWIVGGSPHHPYRLYHWSDGAWNVLPTPDASQNHPPTVDLVNVHVAYLAQQHGARITLWKTVNDGKKWTKVFLPLS